MGYRETFGYLGPNGAGKTTASNVQIRTVRSHAEAIA
jgi:ABC-type multidrug transport system ATPase subunit